MSSTDCVSISARRSIVSEVAFAGLLLSARRGSDTLFSAMSATVSLSDLLCKSGSSRLYLMVTLQELETVWEVYFEDVEGFSPSLGAGPSRASPCG